ncbi:TRAP transporter large permease [Desulforhopalus singaporensis]|uniref:TRAP transporter, DctM subunit n=1 Tax=Desulforhopalus singaporensis TaxID=91360 RepID=A0A1H0RM67_9BACT|nr:TRAP transporter large permease [Desulforhopalus singaporensis]SDP30601.1 TRAP transporter, DctM subunit [Desulforhopalus singaporensis]
MIFVALVILMFCLVIGVPVPVSFMASAAWLIFFGGTGGEGYQASQLLPYGYAQMNSVSLIAIALFIAAGGIMERGKIGEKLIDFVDVFVGHLKGGLGIAGTISCAIVGSICGAACATLSCVGSIMFPRFREEGYPRGLTAALLANASLLGLLIPPNATLIIFAWISGQSVLACFLATVVPGFITIVLLCLVNGWLLRNHETVLASDKRNRTMSDKVRLFKSRGKKAMPALLLPVIVLGGIYGGIMTTTEASAMAVLYAIPVGMFVYKGLNLKNSYEVLVETAVTTGVIMVMLYSVAMLSRLYILEDLPGVLLQLFYAVSDDPLIIMFMINIFLVIMGMLMDDISVVVLSTPVLMPIIMELGFNPIHYAAIVGVNTGLGCITPPAAPVLYLSGRLGGAPIDEMMKPCMWFILLCWMPVLFLTVFFPKISLFLPHFILQTPW